MPRYIEVVQATTETATKILALRAGTNRRGTRRDIRVTTNGGRTASVNWTDDLSLITLNMPSLPPDANLNRAEADRLVAFIAHECCHVLHSDRAVWDQAVKAGARVRDWTNSLEDVRIEAKEIKAGHFPALQGLLSSIANHLHYESVVEARKHKHVIGTNVSQAPYVACILGRMANNYTLPAAAGLAAAMSPDVAKLMTVALAGIQKCRSTADVLWLAKQLAAMEPATPPLPQPPQPGEGSKGEPGEPGEPDEPGDGEGSKGEPDEPGDGEGSKGEPDEPGEPGDGASPGGIPTDASLAETIDKIAARAGIPDLDEHTFTDSSHVLSVVRSQVNTMPAHGNPRDTIASAAVLNQLLPRNAVLHGQIGRLLVSAEIQRRTHHESSGRLDRRALARLRVGATDVFSRRDDSPGIDTALLLLIDCSSSMRASSFVRGPRGGITHGPTRMQIAQATAWAIARAAETANAKVCVAAFIEIPHGGQLTIVKPWASQVQDRAYQLASLDGNGGTPLAPSILAGARMLAEVTATRRIMMVLTDGECDYGPAAVTRACTLADDLGVETVGIGMACALVVEAFPPRYSLNVADLAQLAEKGLGVLVTMLEDANPRGSD